MRMNEHMGHVQQGTRPPAIEQELDDTRETPETRAKRRGAEESRRTGGVREAVAGTTRVLRRYGAGF